MQMRVGVSFVRAGPAHSRPIDCPQDILEKFEFFPVKCRIQRAMEMARVSKERDAARGRRGEAAPFKIKARARMGRGARG